MTGMVGSLTDNPKQLPRKVELLCALFAGLDYIAATLAASLDTT